MIVVPDYRDPALSPEQRASDLLARMTVEEKAGQLFHPYSWLADEKVSPEEALATAREHLQGKLISHVVMVNGTDPAQIAEWTNTLQRLAAETRLGIPMTVSTDPRSGYKSSPYTGTSIDALSRWPEHTGLGAIGDIALAEEYGDIVRRELLAMGIRSYLGPMADLFTEPRWVRGYGTFGEDVDAVSELTAAFIRGLRGGDALGAASVTAVVKHFPGAGPQKDGNDAIDVRYPDQVYPGGMQQLHLRPFERAMQAGATQFMVYYGKPVGTDWEERGFAFNRSVVHDLLRGAYGFDGIVTTDWNVIDAEPFEGEPFGPIAHGAWHLSVSERLALAFDVGIDQFGGDTSTAEVVELVRTGRVSEERIDQSVRRILLEKFRLGLFDAQPADPRSATGVAHDPAFRERGLQAQRRSLTLLTDEGALPIRSGTAVYGEGIEGASRHGLAEVGTPDEADLIVVRLDSPWEPDPDSRLGDFLHGGSLAFPAGVTDRVAALAAKAPTVVIVYLERPAVLTPIVDAAACLVVDYGASDDVVWEALTGRSAFTGGFPSTCRGRRLPSRPPAPMSPSTRRIPSSPTDTACSVTRRARLAAALARSFRSLQVREYRRWSLAQLLSGAGGMASAVAVAWLVVELGGDGVALGLVTGCMMLPTLLLGSVAGAFVDRFSRRGVLIVTQTVQMLVAAAFAVLVFTGTATIPALVGLSLVQGLAFAADNPARQLLVLDIVGRDRVTSAVSMNEVVINARASSVRRSPASCCSSVTRAGASS
ncbi:MFS transporter [Microbacterium sp. NIBRBAC000506063]|nr:MFS transporter [Microbacterium sp. NIBRBAC000506063]